MKKVLKGVEPAELQTYSAQNPTNSWDQFTNSKVRKQQTQQQLVTDQGGLCAYCEIDLKSAANGQVADLRVEHFHPKSDTTGATNWHLDWQNLLACCHGGSQRNVIDAVNRCTSPDHSCDVPKGSNNWDNLILNPLHLPAFPCLFKYNRYDGAIQTNVAHCKQAGVDEIKAKATVYNLRLDAKRLRNMREGTLNKVNKLMREKVAQGLSVDQARRHLAKALLRKDSNNQWPNFFTTIRNYLGSAAEDQLQSINYNG